MIGYHVTSKDNLKSIMRDGLIPSSPKIWNVSKDYIYFYSWGALVSEGKVEEDTPYSDEVMEQHEEFFLKNAIMQGSCTFAKSMSDHLILIKFKIDDESDIENVEVDSSCLGMTHANQYCSIIKPEQFLCVWESNNLGLFKLPLMAQFINNHLYENNIDDYLDDTDEGQAKYEYLTMGFKLAKSCKYIEYSYDDFAEYAQWSPIYSKQLVAA